MRSIHVSWERYRAKFLTKDVSVPVVEISSCDVDGLCPNAIKCQDILYQWPNKKLVDASLNCQNTGNVHKGCSMSEEDFSRNHYPRYEGNRALDDMTCQEESPCKRPYSCIVVIR